jgi:hypothetical protein
MEVETDKMETGQPDTPVLYGKRAAGYNGRMDFA